MIFSGPCVALYSYCPDRTDGGATYSGTLTVVLPGYTPPPSQEEPIRLDETREALGAALAHDRRCRAALHRLWRTRRLSGHPGPVGWHQIDLRRPRPRAYQGRHVRRTEDRRQREGT